MDFPFPVIVCDVGGTNVRSAVVEAPGGPLRHLSPCKTRDFAGLGPAILSVLEGTKLRPVSAIVCAAGPVDGRQVKLTNAPWLIDGTQVAHQCGLSQGLLFNDFEAQALSIPVLRDEWTVPLGNAPPCEGPRLIHGPGTGLGTAALISAGGRWCPIASEAAHSDFAPVTPEERVLWPHVEPVHGRITPEALISGPGLRRLHRARFAARGLTRPEADGVAIVEKALAERSSEEAATVHMFWRLVARFAGDMALAFVARGGVTLAGGILPRIVGLCDVDAFRAAFNDKAPYDWLVSKIPVRVLTEPDTVLSGLAAIAARPDDYLIDYANRAWSSA